MNLLQFLFIYFYSFLICEQINWFHDSIITDVYYYLLLIFGPQIPSCNG